MQFFSLGEGRGGIESILPGLPLRRTADWLVERRSEI